MFFLLGLVYWLGHCEEDAVDQDGEHHNVVKVLVGAEVDCEGAHLRKEVNVNYSRRKAQFGEKCSNVTFKWDRT